MEEKKSYSPSPRISAQAIKIHQDNPTSRECSQNKPDEAHSQLPITTEEKLEAVKKITLEHMQALDPECFPNPPHKKGRPIKATIANVKYFLSRYGIYAKYNVIKKAIEIGLPWHSGSSDNASSVTLTQILSLAILNGMGTAHIPSIIEAVADQNLVNPVADWIMGSAWDGIDRLDAFYDTLVEQEGFPEPLKKTLILRWMISAVAAALKPQGFYCRGILTLQGPQSIGKTSWIRALIPDPILRERVLKLDHHLDASNKDSLITAVTHWIVEIGELDSSLKKDVARLKGFITSDRDKLRRPYARSDSEYQRRTVFCASVNDHSFLVDATGNSRFWTIPVRKIDYLHALPMQQLWAQVAVEYQRGEPWWLTRAEENCLESFNSDHRAISVIRERILERIAIDDVDSSKARAMSAIEVLTALGFEHISNPQCKECAAILREKFGQPKKINGIYKWRIPFKPRKLDEVLPDSTHDDQDLY